MIHSPELVQAVIHLIDTACHYRMDALADLYAPDLLIVMVDENGQTLTFDYAQNRAFFQQRKDSGAAPLNTQVEFNHARIHQGIGYVTATRWMDMGQGEKRIVFTLMLRHDGTRWQVFREHAVITTVQREAEAMKAAARRYYEKINAGELDNEYFALFSDDLELFFPKFGIARGKTALTDFGRRVQSTVSYFGFDLDKFIYTVEGNRLAVEIAEYGTTRSGKNFPDNITSFGKFCCVFEFDAHGKICRYHSYGDPDYAAEDTARVTVFARNTDSV